MNDQEIDQTATESLPKSTEDHQIDAEKQIIEYSNETLKTLEVLRNECSGDLTKSADEADALLNRIIEVHEHAKSVIPGSSNPEETAMNLIAKMANLASQIKKKAYPDIVASTGSMLRAVHFAMNAAHQAQINAGLSAQTVVSCNQRLNVMNQAIESLQGAVFSVPDEDEAKPEASDAQLNNESSVPEGSSMDSATAGTLPVPDPAPTPSPDAEPAQEPETTGSLDETADLPAQTEENASGSGQPDESENNAPEASQPEKTETASA